MVDIVLGGISYSNCVYIYIYDGAFSIDTGQELLGDRPVVQPATCTEKVIRWGCVGRLSDA